MGALSLRLCFASVLQWRMPLALDDGALARLAIAATAIAPHARSSWTAADARAPSWREAAMAAFAKSWRRE
jgi:hypothetical protein